MQDALRSEERKRIFFLADTFTPYELSPRLGLSASARLLTVLRYTRIVPSFPIWASYGRMKAAEEAKLCLGGEAHNTKWGGTYVV